MSGFHRPSHVRVAAADQRLRPPMSADCREPMLTLMPSVESSADTPLAFQNRVLLETSTS